MAIGYSIYRSPAVCLASLCLLVVILSPPTRVFAQAGEEKELLAVLDFDIIAGSKPQAAALTNQLRAEMLKTGRVILVDRSQMEAILEEQAFQQMVCTSQECAVQVGQILGIRKIVAGSLTKLTDNLWQVSVLLIDVETSVTLKAETITHDGDFRRLLLEGMAKVAELLTGAPPIEGATQERAAILSLIGQQPGDTLFLDGRPVITRRSGRYALAPGAYTLKVEREGFKSREEKFTVGSGQSLPLQLETLLEPVSGYLTVREVPPGTNISIAGGTHKPTQLQKALPLRRLPLPIGSYELTVVLPDNDTRSYTVSVQEEEESVVTVSEVFLEENRDDRRFWAWWVLGGAAVIYTATVPENKRNADEKRTQLASGAVAPGTPEHDSTVASIEENERNIRRASAISAAMLAWALWLYFVDPDLDFEPVSLAPIPAQPGAAIAMAYTLRW